MILAPKLSISNQSIKEEKMWKLELCGIISSGNMLRVNSTELIFSYQYLISTFSQHQIHLIRIKISNSFSQNHSSRHIFLSITSTWHNTLSHLMGTRRIRSRLAIVAVSKVSVKKMIISTWVVVNYRWRHLHDFGNF